VQGTVRRIELLSESPQFHSASGPPSSPGPAGGLRTSTPLELRQHGTDREHSSTDFGVEEGRQGRFLSALVQAEDTMLEESDVAWRTCPEGTAGPATPRNVTFNSSVEEISASLRGSSIASAPSDWPESPVAAPEEDLYCDDELSCSLALDPHMQLMPGTRHGATQTEYAAFLGRSRVAGEEHEASTGHAGEEHKARQVGRDGTGSEEEELEEYKTTNNEETSEGAMAGTEETEADGEQAFQTVADDEEAGLRDR
jgi:hypothetical protein